MKLLARVLSRDGDLFQGIVAVLVVALIASLLFPLPAQGQLGLGLAAIVSLLQSIYDVIRNEIGKFLDEIRTLTRWFNEYYQLVLFPRKAIEAARLSGQERTRPHALCVSRVLLQQFHRRH